jgi:uncharacterized protein (DUF342 family)
MREVDNGIHFENGLGFKLSADNKKLIAVVKHCNNKIDLTSSLVKQRLEQENLADFFINDYQVFELVRRYKNATDGMFEFEIGERRDGNCEIYLARDKMSARLLLTPSFGGKVITIDDVQQLLAEKGIIFGIAPIEEIQAVLDKRIETDFVIAKGEDALSGCNTQFQCLVPDVSERHPLINEDGSVNYRELGDIVMVKKDDVIMQRLPPVNGHKGQNVLGEILDATEGVNIPYNLDKQSVYLNPEDRNQLMAAIAGQPIIVENGMVISPVYELDQVDLSSGNVRFDGTVIVKGDVIDGMKIYAQRDIIIEGNVSSSRVECMGNLTVKGGVTGMSELVAGGDMTVKGGVQGFSETEESSEELSGAKIVAYGSVYVGFSESFIIEADGDIVVEKYAMNSHLLAKDKIVAGRKNSSKKSSIIGGVTWASTLIRAAVIGSEVGVKTFIRVGSNPHIERRIAAIRQELALNEKKQQSIRKSLMFIRANPQKSVPDMIENLNYTLEQLIKQVDMFHAELRELVSNLKPVDKSKVIAERGVFIGTVIKMNHALWQAQENRGKSVFTLVKREINVESR